ncbi:MAG: DUF1559 domain-containing protein, partial [Planctomycetota bacterium]
TGGWGWAYVGDADRGNKGDQPGGWLFNTMPYIEESNGHEMCKDGDFSTLSQTQLEGARQVVTSPLSMINCPTRRPNGVFPKPVDGVLVARNAARNDRDNNVAGRTCYAINAGDNRSLDHPDGPRNYEAAETYAWLMTNSGRDPRRPQRFIATGVSFQRSEIKLRHVVDGTSKTYLVVEKYLNPEHYDTGRDGADNETWCTGYNNDNYRMAGAQPLQDRPGFGSGTLMGSAHNSGFTASMCDGSVHFVNYYIDLDVHKSNGNRRDAKTVRR